MNEIWKDITGFEGFYQVSNLGRVKSLGRRCTVHNIRRHSVVHDEQWFRCSKLLKFIYHHGSGPCVHLYDAANFRHSFHVKVLVASMFLNEGKLVSTRQVKLKDTKDKANLTADNLYIVYK